MDSKIKLDWKECFGSGRQYTILMVKSQHEPMRFAARLAKIFRKNFTFLADYAPVPDLHPDILFPTYFSVIDAAKNTHMLVMANRTPVPSASNGTNPNPLLGIPLFDEENFYFFNNRRNNQLFKCSSQRDFDFLIFLYSNKDTSISDVIQVIMEQDTFMTEDITYYLLPDMQKTEASKRISVLQNLIEYFGVMMNNKLEAQIRQQVGNKAIPMSNYVHRRFQVEQVITSSLMEREDI